MEEACGLPHLTRLFPFGLCRYYMFFLIPIQQHGALKDFPVTSVKKHSGPARAPFELDIEEEDGTIGRMHFDDVRSIDKLRVIDKKGYRSVLTPRSDIVAAFKKYMNL